MVGSMRTFGHRRTDRLTDGAGFIGPEGGSNKSIAGTNLEKMPENPHFCINYAMHNLLCRTCVILWPNREDYLVLSFGWVEGDEIYPIL